MNPSDVRARLTKVRAQISRPPDLSLALRMTMWAVLLRGLKYVVPLSILLPLMRTRGAGTARALQREQQVVILARWACRFMAWRGGGNCLERALVTYRYLCALGAEPLVVVGLGRRPDGQLRGHAWVVVDGKAVDDTTESLDGLEQLAVFGPDGGRVPATQSY